MSKKDEILETLKSLAVAGLPLVLPPHGVALLTLANECFNSSGKLRQDKWNAEIASRIANLNAEMEQKIRETSNFASILASAQRGALEDMEEDKVALYANAVINAIKNEDIDNTKKHIFLNMLRDFTKLHIEILRFYSEIEEKIKVLRPGIHFSLAIENTENWYNTAYKCEPKLFQNKTLCMVAYEELVFHKLLKNDGYVLTDGCALNNNYPSKQTTQFADEFLAFIAEQENAND